MGVSITCTNPKYSFDMGYIGFFNLRKNVALSLDKEFGELYSTLSKMSEEHDFWAKASQLIKSKHLEDEYEDVLMFLFLPDCDGHIGYKTCGKIANLLENNYDSLYNKVFRYAAQTHDDYREFILFLKDCYSHRKNMIWY